MSEEQFTRPLGATASAGPISQTIQPMGIASRAEVGLLTVKEPVEVSGTSIFGFTSRGTAEQLDGRVWDGRVDPIAVEQMARDDRLQDALTQLRHDFEQFKEAAQMSLIHNERTKLLANALDRASTAFFTVGIASPTAGYLYGLGQAPFGIEFLAGSFLLWFAAGITLHLFARSVLEDLEE